MVKLGKTIKSLRIETGLKQKELAEKIGISPNYLSLIENDKREPSISLIEKIAEVLNIPASYIMWHALERPKNLPQEQINFYDTMKDLLSEIQMLREKYES
ncbi:helix-turn-helix transcriptional regulator [bacterium]|nr:helix-turn-helix transcriptional regulator [bacterium]